MLFVLCKTHKCTSLARQCKIGETECKCYTSFFFYFSQAWENNFGCLGLCHFTSTQGFVLVCTKEIKIYKICIVIIYKYWVIGLFKVRLNSIWFDNRLKKNWIWSLTRYYISWALACTYSIHLNSKHDILYKDKDF